MKKHAKLVWKEFRRSFGRFVAIMAIIAVGVGFLIGIMDATPDMRRTMDDYYDSHAVYDVQVKTALGLYANELKTLQSALGVETVTAVNSLDVAALAGGSKVAARITGLDFADRAVNLMDIETGRWPEADDECVAEQGSDVLTSLAVGDTIRITDTTLIADKLTVREFRVVGVVTDPLYYQRTEAERTAVGSGRIGAIAYVPESAIGMTDLERRLAGALGQPDARSYTDVYVTVSGAAAERVFTDAYEDRIEACADALAAAAKACVQARNDKLDAWETLLAQMPEGAEKEQYLALLGLARSYAGADWYVLPRTQNLSYASMAINIDKVGAIAGIFPIFFIVVAALVALVTMTKMVEEDRSQIGTLKALGYSKARILAKYLVYCGAATLLGVGLGMLCGFRLLPSIIWSGYQSLYRLPSLALGFNWVFLVTVPLIALAGTFAVTVYATLRSLRESPAELMLPAAPKPGKRILLERVGFVWKRLKFKHKAMLRNIFRYKRNLLMTVIAVAGCTALMVAGFGLRDSVEAIAVRQFDELYRYDLTVELGPDVSATGTLDGFLAEIGPEAYTAAYRAEGSFLVGGDKEPATLYAVDPARIGGFIEFRTRRRHRPIAFDADTVVISETLANAYGVRVGDEFRFAPKGADAFPLRVGAITEQYVDCTVYAARPAVEAALGGAPGDNFLFVRAEVPQAERNALSERLLGDSRVSAVTFKDATRTAYDNMLDMMVYVVLVLIFSAGALAVVVLYNLTNINIDERRREIATLKVLGYHQREVAGYVYRESMFLTVLGALIGLGIGALLHLFVVIRVEAANMMLGRTISWMGFVVPLLLTLAFAAIVDLVMLVKLKRVEMEDSLKATD